MYYIQPTIDGNSYSTTSDFLTVGTTETNILLLDNPSASTKKLVLCQITLGSKISILQEGKSILKIYRNPVVTNSGTLLNALNM